MPCCTVLCRALQSFLFRTYQTATLACIQSWREPTCLSSSIGYISLHFPLLFGLQQTSSSSTYAAINSSTAVVCTSMYVVEPRAQQSTAQLPPDKAANLLRADQSTCQKKDVRTCMLRPVCFPGAWSSWHLQVACLHLKCWTIYFTTSVCNSNPCLFVSELSGRKRCTGIQQQQYSSGMYEYVRCR